MFVCFASCPLSCGFVDKFFSLARGLKCLQSAPRGGRPRRRTTTNPRPTAHPHPRAPNGPTPRPPATIPGRSGGVFAFLCLFPPPISPPPRTAPKNTPPPPSPNPPYPHPPF